MYPNPSKSGVVAVETLEDLVNADLQVYTLDGKIVYSERIGLFNQRRVVNLTGMSQGQYIVRVRAAGFNVAKRFVVEH